MRRVFYLCDSCGFRLASGGADHVPVHCGKQMNRERVPSCSVPYDPGMVREYYNDEPCDDGWSYRSP